VLACIDEAHEHVFALHGRVRLPPWLSTRIA
jgi:hypothetical protein